MHPPIMPSRDDVGACRGRRQALRRGTTPIPPSGACAAYQSLAEESVDCARSLITGLMCVQHVYTDRMSLAFFDSLNWRMKQLSAG